MLIGILSDTHNASETTQKAMELFRRLKVNVIVHCGDLNSPEIVKICSELPFYFVFGNHDSDMVADLKRAANQHGAVCLGWGGFLPIEQSQIAVCHGHMTKDLKPLLDSKPDYLLTGHSHAANIWQVESTTRINPGALFRATTYTVAVLNLDTTEIKIHEID